MKWKNDILATVDNRNNKVAFDVGPSKELHRFSSTDGKTEELGHMNIDHKVSYSYLTKLQHMNQYRKVSHSDLTDDELIRSLIDDQNDMHADRLSREISYFMDNYLQYSDFIEDEIVRSLIDEQNDMHADTFF